MLDDPGTRPLQPREKEAWLQLQLAADLGITHLVLVLGVCRMQDLRCQEGFCSDLRRRPVRPGRVPLRGPCVTLKFK